MKVGVSSYCFQRLYDRGEMTVFDEIKFAAEIGCQCIEFTNHAAPQDKAGKLSWAKDVRAACEEAGLEISAWTVFADFLNGPDGDVEKEIARVEDDVDVCEALGAPLMRHDASWGYKSPAFGARAWEDAVAQIAPAIRRVTEYAAKKGIRTMSENHGYFFQDSERMVKLIRAVNHENYGWLVDMGNFACADEDSAHAVGVAAPYAFHVHAKDFLRKSGALGQPDDSWFPTRGGDWLRGTVLGHGVIPVGQCVGALRRAGYAGTVSLEFEGLEDVREAVKYGVAALKNCCGG